MTMMNSNDEILRFYQEWGFFPISGGALDDNDPNGDMGDPDPAPDPAPDTKIEVSEKEYKDLKGFREKAGDDFDAEKWGKLKSFDPDKVAENMEFGSAVEKDNFVQAVLRERLAAQKEGRKVSMAKIMADFKDELDSGATPDLKASAAPKDPRIDAHEEYIRKQQEKEIVDAFNKGFDEEFKTQKLSLSTREKSFLNKLVEQAFMDNLKLTMKDLPSVMKESSKEVLEYRKELQQQWNKEISGDLPDEGEEAPTPVSGTPAQPGKKGYDPRKATSAERVGVIANELRERGYGN